MGLEPKPTRPDQLPTKPRIKKDVHVLRSSPKRKYASLLPHLDRYCFESIIGTRPKPSICGKTQWNHTPSSLKFVLTESLHRNCFEILSRALSHHRIKLQKPLSCLSSSPWLHLWRASSNNSRSHPMKPKLTNSRTQIERSQHQKPVAQISVSLYPPESKPETTDL
ncbi:hypothetical protein Bca4012_026283 [Brassica carinata]|uniref:Uncharacterized protein n=1 Tax=Brassica carinata TaxID=52824 RepID=A0A8X8AUG9_BRACI|nr:hypothetical protein Bca52824_023370 [Brassica carinata]